MATELLTQAIEAEVQKAETPQTTACVLGMLAHLSGQLQLLLECMSGITPTRTAVEITVVEPEEVN